MTLERIAFLAAALGLCACADTPEPAAQSAAAPPSAADTSANSPMTVNPPAEGQALPDTPPTLPESGPRADDKSMPPGPVN